MGWRPQNCAHLTGMRLECRWFLALRDCAVNRPERWVGAALDGSAVSQARCARGPTRALLCTRGEGPSWASRTRCRVGLGPPSEEEQGLTPAGRPLACPLHPGRPSSHKPRCGQASWGDGRGLSGGGGHLGNRPSQGAGLLCREQPAPLLCLWRLVPGLPGTATFSLAGAECPSKMETPGA